MSIRQILLQVFVVGLGLGALIEPRVGLLGYVWYALARPDALTWSEGSQYHSLILAIVTLCGAWRYVPNIGRWAKNPWVISLLLLHATFIGSILGANNSDAAWLQYLTFVRSTLLCFAIPLFIVALKDLKALYLTIAFATGLIGVKFGLFGLVAGGIHLESGLGGHIGDNNLLCAAFVIGLPFLWFSAQCLSKPLRLVSYCALFMTIAAIVMTHSRGGFLSLVAVLLLLVWRSRYKSIALVIFALMLIPSIWLTADTILPRLESIAEYQSDGSASSRLRYWGGAIRMFSDNPLLGVGFGTLNWVELSSRYLEQENEKKHVVHNNYLQMAVDSGAFALILLLWQIFFSIWWLEQSARRVVRADPAFAMYPQTLQASMVGFAVSSTFLSRTDYDFYYFLIMTIGAWWGVSRDLPEHRDNKSHALQVDHVSQSGSGASVPTGSSAVPAKPEPRARDRMSPLRRTRSRHLRS